MLLKTSIKNGGYQNAKGVGEKIMIGLLTYLPTTAYFPQYIFLLAFLFILIRERGLLLESFTQFYRKSSHPINWNFLIVVLIILFSTLNRIIHWDTIGDVATLFPYFILLIPTYVIAIGFNKNDAKVLVFLIAIEAVVVILEWFMGVSSFDSSLAGFKAFEVGDLVYNQRPLGISESSSHIAAKLFLGWLMLDFYGFKNKLWWTVKGVLLAAIIFTFNRSVLLSLGVYLVISQTVGFLKLRYKLEDAIVGLVTSVVGAAAFIGGGIMYGEQIFNQVTRNKGTVELTGREYLWKDFGDFIFEHLAYGNNSVKLWMDGYHAHNSYIEVIATNGVFIAFLYFLLIYRNIKSSNWLFVVPVLVFGLTQYAFFWGISLMDILFWVILFTVPEKEKCGSAISKPIGLTLSQKQ